MINTGDWKHCNTMTAGPIQTPNNVITKFSKFTFNLNSNKQI